MKQIMGNLLLIGSKEPVTNLAVQALFQSLNNGFELVVLFFCGNLFLIQFQKTLLVVTTIGSMFNDVKELKRL